MERLSNCCGANEWFDNTDICGDCKEHAEFEEGEEFVSQRKIDWIKNWNKQLTED